MAVRGPYSEALPKLDGSSIHFGLGLWVPDSLAAQGFRDDTPCVRSASTAAFHMNSISKSLRQPSGRSGMIEPYVNSNGHQAT